MVLRSKKASATPTKTVKDDLFHSRPFASWGGVVRRTYPMASPQFRDESSRVLANRPTANVLGVGLGRSYGCSNTLAGGSLVDMTRLDRIMLFDREAGVLRAEAGLSLSDALRVIVPQGWFLPTTPGSRFVTLGGAVANDVHGKNHHRAGSLGCAVRAIGLVRSDGKAFDLSPESHAALFAATIGGLGLTGLITWVEIALARIPGSNLACERTLFHSIREFIDLSDDVETRFEHSVAWIDCRSGGGAFGRGIFEAANWVSGGLHKTHQHEPRLSIPLEAPSFIISNPTVRLFNEAYFRAKSRKAGPYTQHYGGFFYPLDTIGQWNRLYGRRGFYQYQCVIPTEHGIMAIEDMLKRITRSGNASFLAVLKTFGPRLSPGMLSFPREGLTLALDFPNHGPDTLNLFSELDTIVAAAGGRLYAAKNARMPRALFESGYPRLSEFKNHVDPAFSSDFWKAMTE